MVIDPNSNQEICSCSCSRLNNCIIVNELMFIVKEHYRLKCYTLELVFFIHFCGQLCGLYNALYNFLQPAGTFSRRSTSRFVLQLYFLSCISPVQHWRLHFLVRSEKVKCSRTVDMTGFVALSEHTKPKVSPCLDTIT